MPAKIIFDKEKVACAAYSIIERYGLDALNARSLAKELGCSTQPIYSRYKDLEEVKNAADAIIRKTYADYLKEGLKSQPNLFNGYLKAYIKFADEKPNLFAYLFMRFRGDETIEDARLHESIVSAISDAGGYDACTAEKFFSAAWLFAHGIACQTATGFFKRPERLIDELLNDEFEALKTYYGRKNVSDRN